jgi:RHS repeat-associated protein
VLAARLISDANRNRSAVAFDALGMVAATALMGKPEEQLGDSLAGLDPDPGEATVAAYLADPLADPHSLLGQATTRIVYDLSGFQRAHAAGGVAAPVVAMIVRETHVSDLAAGQSSAVQHRLAYSDGFGREIQRKTRAEAGRWVGSGWTIFNNKGKPVRQYEPYFSATHAFEFAAIAGVSPVLCYDPVGRGVATLGADHTWTKVAFDPWRQEAWDANDTVLTDPLTDPVVGDHARRLPSTDYLPGWYAARATGGLGPHEQSAALAAGAHAATPGVAYLDPLGRTALTVAHNRSATQETFLATLSVLDVEGNQRLVVDADGRTVVSSDYDMLGKTIHSLSMDAGERWTLNDVAGQPIRAWDSREHRVRTAYDALGRPSGIHLQTGSAAEQMVGRTVYGESQPDAAALNLRGKPYQTFDGAGVATLANYDFKGNAGTTSRRLAVEYRSAPDWASAVTLQAQVFTSRTGFDALNRPATITAPDGSTIRLAYNEGNLLDAVDVNLHGEGVWTPFVAGIDYDAKGQRTRVAYGNGVVTAYEYDPLTFRLTRAHTEGSAGERLQDLSYVYDPVGNVTHIGDAAQPTVFFRNTVVEPGNDFLYDAIYQLVEATGREHVGQLNTAPDAFDTDRAGLEHPSDGAAMARYLERFVYDPAGNLTEMRHIGSDAAHPGWTRTFTYTPGSNRLSATQVGAGPGESFGYDAHGAMTSLPHLSLIRWNHLDRLEASARQVVNSGTPETTYYVYDSAGERVRKVTESQAGPDDTPVIAHERIYLGGFEIYREYSATGSTSLERQTLHVMDGRRRLAMVETRTAGDDGSPPRLIRYQLANHLGSASLELDGAGALISYEEFYPFGSTSFQAVNSSIRAAGKRYRYTGKERDDETGLSHHGARYYLPWLGRWLSADPLGIGGGLNVYRYADNNPVRLVDPSGMAPIETDPTDVRGHHYVPKDVYKGKGLPQNVYDFFAGATSGYVNDWHNRQAGHKVYTAAVEQMFQQFQAANGPWTVAKARDFLELVMTQPSNTTVGSFIDELHVAMERERGTKIGNTNVSSTSRPGAEAVVDIAEDNDLMKRALGGALEVKLRTYTEGKGIVPDKSGSPSVNKPVFDKVMDEVMANDAAAKARRTPTLSRVGSGAKAFAADTAPLEIGVAVSDYVFADEIERKKSILRTGHIRDLSAENQKFMYEQFGLYPVVKENGLIENWKWDLSTMAGFSDWAKGWIRLFGGNLEDPFAAATPYDPNMA